MARPRSFDEADVIRAAAELFASRTYDGTSIDDLVAHLGVHRNSLYKTFGSKRGLYLAALRWSLEHDIAPLAERVAAGEGPLDALRESLTAPDAGAGLDLLLLAAAERAPEDAEVASLVTEGFAALDRAAATPVRADSSAGGDALATALTAAILGLRLRARSGTGATALDAAGAALAHLLDRP
ncbi:TetR/AcrR family transcriptional regulator [Streptomyces sp. NPDC051018]|uniref:TetR/AcrR family transcriptional regulator n=1 Tax=Streptomyces sp. NPDC051018 TaxID=3365639 RepID=UPI0037ACC45C